MKLLVTGGAGFIGSYLCEKLLGMGHSVISLDDLSTGKISNLQTIMDNPNLKVIQGSVVDEKLVNNLIKDADGCFHMAAAVGVKKILDDPIGSLETNLQGSHNVIKSAAKYGKRLLLASTSEIYGKNPNQPLTEESDRVIGSPLLSRWTYSEAKAIDESLARAYYERDGLKVHIVRLFNTVGPRQSSAYGMVIPRFFESAISNKDLQIHGEGNQRRVFCHVRDAVDGILSLWNTDEGIGQAFNVGGIEEISINELAHKIVRITKSQSKLSYIPYHELRKKGFEDMERRIPNSDKLLNLTGWKAQYSLDRILDDFHLELVEGR